MLQRIWRAWFRGLILVSALFGAACPSSEEAGAVRCGPRVQVIDGEEGFAAQIRFTATAKSHEGGTGTWRFIASDSNISLRQYVRAPSDHQAVVTATSPVPTTFTLTGSYQSDDDTVSLPATCRVIVTTPHPDAGLSVVWARAVAQEVIPAGLLTPVSFQLRERDGRPATGRDLVLSTDSAYLAAAESVVTTDANGMAKTRLLKMRPGSGHLIVTLSHFAHRLEVATLPGPAHPEASTFRLLRAHEMSTGEVARTYQAQFFDRFGNPHGEADVKWRLFAEGCHLIAAAFATTAAGDAEATCVCARDVSGALHAEARGLSLIHPVGPDKAL